MKPRREVDHRHLDDVSRRPLHPGVEGDPLSQLPDVLIWVLELLYVPPTPEEGDHVRLHAFLLGSLLGLRESVLDKLRHFRVALEVALDVTLGLDRVDVPEAAREPEAR